MASESTRPDPGLWYRIGYVMERARQARPRNVRPQDGEPSGARSRRTGRGGTPVHWPVRGWGFGIGLDKPWVAGLRERKAASEAEAGEPGARSAGHEAASRHGDSGGAGRYGDARSAGRHGDPDEAGRPGGSGGRHAGSGGSRSRAGGRRRSDQELGGPGADWPTPEELVATVLAALVGRVVGGGGKRPGFGVLRLLRAGLSGAASAVLIDLLRPVLYGGRREVRVEGALGDRMLAGAAQGLVYAAVVEPLFPGPSLLKGALFGSAEYATETSGGLGHLMRAQAPYGKVPGVGELVERMRPKERAYVEHVVFGIALALLYGSSRSSNGIRIEVEADE